MPGQLQQPFGVAIVETRGMIDGREECRQAELRSPMMALWTQRTGVSAISIWRLGGTKPEQAGVGRARSWPGVRRPGEDVQHVTDTMRIRIGDVEGASPSCPLTWAM